MTKKYDAVMDKIQLSREMRIRILNEISNTNLDDVVEINASQKSSNAMTQLKYVASILIICIGAVAVSKVININTEPPVQVIPQIFEYETPEELSTAVNFEVTEPMWLPFTPEETKYISYWGNLAEIVYSGASNEITFRMSKVNEDISGDYNDYAVVKSIDINDAMVTIKGDESGYKAATWSVGDYSYSLSSTAPLSQDEIIDLINSIH